MLSDLEALALDYVPLTERIGRDHIPDAVLIRTARDGFPDLPPDLIAHPSNDLADLMSASKPFSPTQVDAILALLLLDKFPSALVGHPVIDLFRFLPLHVRVVVYPHLFKIIDPLSKGRWFYRLQKVETEDHYCEKEAVDLIVDYCSSQQIPLSKVFTPAWLDELLSE